MANILLAEDDRSMRTFVAAALEKSGHKVTSCSDGTEALAALESGAAYDLLLTDIVMPGMDGLELSARAGALSPKTKVMFITGFAAMALGSADPKNPKVRVISKPFHLGKLIEEVDRILAG
ncbi:MAG TPA: response regulator [Micavibrio sp.]|nr:response regulator [Micavibrio sp.]